MNLEKISKNYYLSSGELIKTNYYDSENIKIKKKIFYNNGNLLSKTKYFKEKKEITIVYYLKNILRSLINYNNNKIDGLVIEFYESGFIKSLINYKNNMINGQQYKFYDKVFSIDELKKQINNFNNLYDIIKKRYVIKIENYKVLAFFIKDLYNGKKITKKEDGSIKKIKHFSFGKRIKSTKDFLESGDIRKVFYNNNIKYKVVDFYPNNNIKKLTINIDKINKKLWYVKKKDNIILYCIPFIDKDNIIGNYNLKEFKNIKDFIFDIEFIDDIVYIKGNEDKKSAFSKDNFLDIFNDDIIIIDGVRKISINKIKIDKMPIKFKNYYHEYKNIKIKKSFNFVPLKIEYEKKYNNIFKSMKIKQRVFISIDKVYEKKITVYSSEKCKEIEENINIISFKDLSTSLDLNYNKLLNEEKENLDKKNNKDKYYISYIEKKIYTYNRLGNISKIVFKKNKEIYRTIEYDIDNKKIYDIKTINNNIYGFKKEIINSNISKIKYFYKNTIIIEVEINNFTGGINKIYKNNLGPIISNKNNDTCLNNKTKLKILKYKPKTGFNFNLINKDNSLSLLKYFKKEVDIKFPSDYELIKKKTNKLFNIKINNNDTIINFNKILRYNGISLIYYNVEEYKILKKYKNNELVKTVCQLDGNNKIYYKLIILDNFKEMIYMDKNNIYYYLSKGNKTIIIEYNYNNLKNPNKKSLREKNIFNRLKKYLYIKFVNYNLKDNLKYYNFNIRYIKNVYIDGVIKKSVFMDKKTIYYKFFNDGIINEIKTYNVLKSGNIIYSYIKYKPYLDKITKTYNILNFDIKFKNIKKIKNKEIKVKKNTYKNDSKEKIKYYDNGIIKSKKIIKITNNNKTINVLKYNNYGILICNKTFITDNLINYNNPKLLETNNFRWGKNSIKILSL